MGNLEFKIKIQNKMGKNATKLNNNKSVVTNAKNDGGKA